MLFCLALTAASAPSDRLARAEEAWVSKTLKSLTLEQKAAQMLMIRAAALPSHRDAPERRDLRAAVGELQLGGVVLFRSELDAIPGLIEELQAISRVPLWFGTDEERSLGLRVPVGPVSLPDAMAFGAIQPPADAVAAARFAGELTARESRAAGIQWAFAPVADVNDNPQNPIINLRSFGEDPERVAELVEAFVEGARSGGLLTAVKHFPGHGDTAVNSHLELPVIGGNRARLDRVELAPFRAAIAAGVDGVMTGHLAVPALDASGAPASLSSAISTKLLRDELGFRGLVMTDALDMRGVGSSWLGEAVVRAVAAGADMVLLPPDPRVAVQSIARAVREGQLPEARLDASVRRILEMKARLGLQHDRTVERTALHREIGRPGDVARADEIARRAITLVRNDGGILPLHAEEPVRVLQLVVTSEGGGGIGGAAATTGGILADELEKRGIEVETRRLGAGLAPEQIDGIVEAAQRFTHVLVSASVRVSSDQKGSADLDPTHAALIEHLAAAGVKLVVAALGSPYLLRQVPHAPVYLCTFSSEEASQRALAGALFGESEISGRLPITISDSEPGWARGGGLTIPRRALELAPSTPEEAGFRSGGLADVDRIVERFVEEKAFPGAVIAVGRHGRLAHLRAFGKLSYDEGASQTTPETIYDIASLSKIVVTTTLAMQMVDEERLVLDATVQSFLPQFRGPNKEKVTVRHLLTHSSGIDWWAPLYKEARSQADYVEKICAMPLVYEPGSATKYSDLGIILLGEIVERVAGVSLARMAQEQLLEPLGLERTIYNPLPGLFSNLAPTEVDPETGRPLRGVVHDENARAMGGVAPHAGLFSTAPDLAKFAQMILWRGVYAQHRFVRRDTVELFTRRADLPPGSSRALGWDTKSREGSSSGVLFSPGSFGHTGFTGTSIWIDPERDLFVVLLTNHVHPTRENKLIREARPAIHDAVIRALEDAPPVVRNGLDRVDAGEVPELAGRRLGLLSNFASVTIDGRQAIAVFRERGLNVVRLFSPEHGLKGQAAAGEKVESGTDADSGLPLVSLFGTHTKPAPEDLAGLDALVIDLQDAGVRFYSYASTLLLCLEAAADAGIELVVLDRPNPLGGERVAGPQRDSAERVAPTLWSMAPGTLIHGLTLGEMARYANARRPKPARLTVVSMAGWKRSMTWFDTGRRWFPSSPNLRSASAAIAYPGVALLEATNVSEGRGTDSPFLLIGAPWIDPAKVKINAPGFRLTAVRFTPRTSAAATDPKYRDIECAGLRIELTDPAAADPWRLGVELVRALGAQPGFAWLGEGSALTGLLGAAGPAALRADPAAATAKSDAWRAARQPALLYE